MIVGVLRNVVKVLACVFISVALGLEFWNILAQDSLYADWPIVFWLGRLALISHGFEAVIAAFYAPSRGRSPLTTGIYTFFVGTVGLLELFQLSQEQLNRNF